MDERYRLLQEGEIVLATDEILNDHNHGWVPVTNSIGEPAPSPLYTAHRLFRRLRHELFDSWLERTIQERFPDNLNISPGQLRVRVFILVDEALRKTKSS